MPYQQQQQQCPGFQPNKCFNNNIIFYNIYNTIYFHTKMSQTTPTELFSMYEIIFLVLKCLNFTLEMVKSLSKYLLLKFNQLY